MLRGGWGFGAAGCGAVGAAEFSGLGSGFRGTRNNSRSMTELRETSAVSRWGRVESLGLSNRASLVAGVVIKLSGQPSSKIFLSQCKQQQDAVREMPGSSSAWLSCCPSNKQSGYTKQQGG